MGWMMISWLIGLLLLAVLVYFLVRSLGYGSDRSKAAPDDSKRILRERYARGEIDEQELHRRMHELQTES